jgi:hypothetical protein
MCLACDLTRPHATLGHRDIPLCTRSCAAVTLFFLATPPSAFSACSFCFCFCIEGKTKSVKPQEDPSFSSPVSQQTKEDDKIAGQLTIDHIFNISTAPPLRKVCFVVSRLYQAETVPFLARITLRFRNENICIDDQGGQINNL